MIFKQLTEHHLEFLSLKEGCRGSSESTLAKMSNCWKSHAAAFSVWLSSARQGNPILMMVCLWADVGQLC